MITPNWNAPKHIKAFSSTRRGGFSVSPYQSLNLGTHVGDALDTVERNRAWLASELNMPNTPIWLNQTHSTIVSDVSSHTTSVLDADGVFTRSSNIVCSAMTADCMPVLLTDTKGTQVAAVHAGWRGLSGGILENTLDKFDGDVIAWLGPAIGANAFEVSSDVLEAFTHDHADAEKAFIATGTPNKWWANMSMLATQRLNALGVELVYDSGHCTYQNANAFYSYRRDGITGRQASFIWIED